VTTPPRYIWFNGAIVPYESAQVHVLSTAVKYAAAVFEGLRGYWNAHAGQLYLFRVTDHLERLEQSARVARMPVPVTSQELAARIVELVHANDLRQDIHVRVLAYVSADDGMLDSTEPVGVTIATMPMGRFPEARASDGGLDVCVSHWRRNSDDAAPPRVKTTGNYFNGRLALLQARNGGYDDAILTDAAGKVSEGPGYNIFIVRHGELSTPPVTQGILEGITRDTVIGLYRQAHGTGVSERVIDKSELYVADEAFYCGSAKEITPIRSVDGISLRAAPGPVTQSLSARYQSVVRGDDAERMHWLTAVY
jgi:branched-chain amino acid aminotransferase